MSSVSEHLRRVLRGAIPKPLYVRAATLLDSAYGVRMFGLRGFQELSALRRSHIDTQPSPIRLRNLAHPVYVRPGTPDAGVVIQAMARQAYSYAIPSRPINLIVDAGANIGDTAVWYTTQFPDALVVAVEPDPGNLAVLRMNCLPYGDRIRVLHAALWPEPERELVTAGEFIGARVAESENGRDGTCPSIDPLGILRNTPFEMIDILKIDIEGAEEALFSGECDAWLGKTRSIAVEIHSPSAARAVFSATRRNGFTHDRYRNVHFFWRNPVRPWDPGWSPF